MPIVLPIVLSIAYCIAYSIAYCIAYWIAGPGSQARTGPRGRGRDPLGQGPGGPWAQDVGYAWRQ